MPSMSTTSSAPVRTVGRLPLAALTAAGAIAPIAALYGPYDRWGEVRAILMSAALLVLLTAIVFGPVMTRAQNRRRAATWLGALSLLAFPAFWLGIPLVLGPAAVLLGRETGARVAIVLGALGWLAGLAAVVGGLVA